MICLTVAAANEPGRTRRDSGRRFDRSPTSARMSVGERVLVFEWDVRKAGANLRKHQVGFEEAASVFGDPLARIFADDAHSASEAREIIVGRSPSGRVLLVCFTEVEEGRVRLISARRATRKEMVDYEGFAH